MGDLSFAWWHECAHLISELVHRLAALVTNKNHMTALQQAALMSQIVLTRYRVSINSSIGFERDSAAMNGACTRRLSITLPAAEDVLCLPWWSVQYCCGAAVSGESGALCLR